MKALIVFYSRTGSTELIINTAKSETGIPTRQLIDLKSRNGIAGAGFAALFGLKTELKNPNYNVADYDTLFLATPVWAGHPTPAMNTFIRNTDLKGKNVYLVAIAGSGEAVKALNSLKVAVEKKGGHVINTSTYKGINPMKKNPSGKENSLKSDGKKLSEIISKMS